MVVHNRKFLWFSFLAKFSQLVILFSKGLKTCLFFGFIVTNFQKNLISRIHLEKITRFFYWHQGFLFPIIWYREFGEIFSKEEKLFELTIEKKSPKISLFFWQEINKFKPLIGMKPEMWMCLKHFYFHILFIVKFP